MLFNSFPFIIFLSLFLPLYFLNKGRFRYYLMLFSSYLFYSWWDWRFLSLLIFSTVFNYLLAHLVEKSVSQRKKKLILIFAISLNLGVLAFFKYFNFFLTSLQELFTVFGWQTSWSLNIILPIGISFFTFQGISYVVDVYKKTISHETDFLCFAIYLSFFPQLVAGPIVRASSFLPVLKQKKKVDYNLFFRGIEEVVIGFFLKVVVSDSLAPVVDRIFLNPVEMNSIALVIGAIFFSFQIYLDFGGYSLIAIGIGKILGFDFGVNFIRPYFSKNFSEFWRRWHVSLSSWLRDYLYIPLGGSREGYFKTIRNLCVTMLLGGLWHGANWTFIVWGGLHGIFLMIQHSFNLIKYSLKGSVNVKQVTIPSNFLFNSFSILTVFFLTTISWVFFRSPSFSDGVTYIERLFSFGDINIYNVPGLFLVLKGGLLISIIVCSEVCIEVYANEKKRLPNSFKVLRLLLLLWGITLFGNFGGKSFIYFQF